MRDAHNAGDAKLEPIIIFVSPPQGARVGLPDPGAETSVGWYMYGAEHRIKKKKIKCPVLQSP